MNPAGELLLSAAAMAELDRRTIEGLGVPGLVLMESAAWACVEELLERWPERVAAGVVCVAGPGNNGADAVAVARRLHLRGAPARIVLLGESAGDRAAQVRIARKAGVPFDEGLALEGIGLIVDGLFGTGLTRAVEPDSPYGEAIRAINAASAPVLAVDIPSGVSGSTGAAPGAAIEADCTVTFAALKLGHLSEPGRSHAGALVRADIGIPTERWPEVTADSARLLDPSCMAAVDLGPGAAHKGTFGHLLVVAGGPGKLGAARLTCEAALRAGAGLVTLAVPGDVPPGLRPEVMTASIPGDDGALCAASVPAVLELLADRAALAIGPGLGTDGSTPAAVRAILTGADVPAVVDADGLNALAPLDGRVPGRDRVLTPHPGEARRLLPPDSSRLDQVRALASRAGAVTLLKGAGTLIAHPGGAARLNPTGHPGMATAGSGDVLTGVIGALLARALPPFEAACAGAYWHGLAGDVAGATPSLVADDLSRNLGPAWAAARHGRVVPPFGDRP